MSASSRPVIYFVRHGETDWNAEGRLQGQRDVPLNDRGRVQAEEAGHKLSQLVAKEGLTIDGLFYAASPLARTRETMDILRGTVGLEPAGYQLDKRWRELSFGQWEGLTWKEVRSKDPVQARLRDADKWHFQPPEGESYEMTAERVKPALEALDRDSVIVSHGGVARAILVMCCGLNRNEVPLLDIWQGRVLVIRDGGYEWV